MSIFDTILKEQIQKMQYHATLVGAGIPPEQALRITHGETAKQVEETLKKIEEKVKINLRNQ